MSQDIIKDTAEDTQRQQVAEHCNAMNDTISEHYGENPPMIVVPVELIDHLIGSAKEAYSGIDYYEDMIKQARDKIAAAELSGKEYTMVDLFQNDTIIPGVNGPRPEHQYLSRDTAVDVLNGITRLKGRIKRRNG